MEFVRVTAFGSDQHNHGSRGDFSKNLFFSNLISQMVPKNSETMDGQEQCGNKQEQCGNKHEQQGDKQEQYSNTLTMFQLMQESVTIFVRISV